MLAIFNKNTETCVVLLRLVLTRAMHVGLEEGEKVRLSLATDDGMGSR